MKEMMIRVPLTENDTKEEVKELIYVALREFGDIFFSIDEVTIDGEKVFGTKNPNGYKKEFFKTN